jgi:hypothetical protein
MKKENIKITIVPVSKDYNPLLTDKIQNSLWNSMNPEDKKVKFNLKNAQVLDLINHVRKFIEYDELKLKQAFLSGVMSSKCLEGTVSNDIFLQMADQYIKELKNNNL